MDYVRLGQTGLTVSRLALGCMAEAIELQLTDEEVELLEGPYVPHGRSWF